MKPVSQKKILRLLVASCVINLLCVHCMDNFIHSGSTKFKILVVFKDKRKSTLIIEFPFIKVTCPVKFCGDLQTRFMWQTLIIQLPHKTPLVFKVYYFRIKVSLCLSIKTEKKTFNFDISFIGILIIWMVSFKCQMQAEKICTYIGESASRSPSFPCVMNFNALLGSGFHSHEEGMH